jgi:phosphoribosylamine---glycine ligase
MRVLLIGHGGREAALAWKIAQSPRLEQLIVAGANPGWPSEASVELANGVQEWVALANRMRADLVVVGPEAPLEQGLADELHRVGIPCFGPSAAAATLETSKAFAKEIMCAAGVKTAGFQRVDTHDPTSLQQARERCERGDVVIKVDGLAAGKGVFVCPEATEASASLEEAIGGRFGAAARHLILEDLIVGPEVSVFALCDGERAVGLPSAQDHKRLLEGNNGPNTGGMGAYVPCPLVDSRQVDELVASVHQPVLDEMRRRGTPFSGVLYAGLMLTDDGPMVLEFNVRFGDPECQPLMQMWGGDILPWLHGAAQGNLPSGKPAALDGAACCVVLASPGYPATSTKGIPIPEGSLPPNVEVFFAGARRTNGILETNGGRVLGITARGTDIAEAQAAAYGSLPEWCFEGAQYRSDIAQGALL